MCTELVAAFAPHPSYSIRGYNLDSILGLKLELSQLRKMLVQKYRFNLKILLMQEYLV